VRRRDHPNNFEILKVQEHGNNSINSHADCISRALACPTQEEAIDEGLEHRGEANLTLLSPSHAPHV